MDYISEQKTPKKTNQEKKAQAKETNKRAKSLLADIIKNADNMNLISKVV